MAENRRVAVIGAGLGGLSCAIRLAHSGYEVDLYEQQSQPGGKAQSRSVKGFRFDTGPSLLTMLRVFRQLFEEVKEDIDDYLRFIPLEPLCTYFYPDGSILKSSSNLDRFAQEIENKTRDSGSSLRKYLRYCKRIYSITADLFLWQSIHHISTYLDLPALKSILRFGFIDPFRSMHRANRSFFKDTRVVQLFDRYATYNGSNPYRMPATFNIIPYVEYGLGGYGIQGGIYALPSALERLAVKKGVRLHLDRRVERIVINDSHIRGIIAEGKQELYDVVVSNVDVLATYKELLNDDKAFWVRRYSKLEPSSSGLVFLWGMDRSFPELGAHNIFFSRDYRKEFQDIFSRKVCPEDPTVYINISSKVTPTDAPQGCENWFVLVNAPCNEDQDWEDQTEKTRERVARKIEDALGRSVKSSISVEEIMTPQDIEKNSASSRGSLYGISSNSPWAAFLRHPNKVRCYKGLYFCGGSVHPGGGMPLAVLSGKIASDMIRKYEPLANQERLT